VILFTDFLFFLTYTFPNSYYNCHVSCTRLNRRKITAAKCVCYVHVVAAVNCMLSETSECQGANCPPEGGFVGSSSRMTMTSLVAMTAAIFVSILTAQ